MYPSPRDKQRKNSLASDQCRSQPRLSKEETRDGGAVEKREIASSLAPEGQAAHIDKRFIFVSPERTTLV